MNQKANCWLALIVRFSSAKIRKRQEVQKNAMRNLNTVYWKFSLQMFYRRLKIQYICFITCLLTSLIIKQMRKISLTRSALVTGCILISSIPLQGKAKNLFQEQDNRITGLIVSRITNTLIHTKHLYSTQST